MARCWLPVTVVTDEGQAVSGAEVTVRDRAGVLATVYAAEAGAATLSNPLSTDDHGRVVGAWVERGKYRIGVAAPGISSYDIYWDAAPAGNGDVNRQWLTFGLIPLGIVFPYAGGDQPSGYLRCNGQEVSRAGFPDLWALIGTTYGAGNGVTTFNVPDLRGRLPVGDDRMGLGYQAGRLTSNNALGQSAGTETHSQTASAGDHTHPYSIPAHAHSVSPGSHTHGFNWYYGGSHVHSGVMPSHTHTFSTSSVGDHGHSIGADGNHQHGVLVGYDQDTSHWAYVAPTYGGGGAVVTTVYHYHGGYTNLQGAHSHGGATGAGGGHAHSGTTAGFGGSGGFTTGSGGGGSGSGTTGSGGSGGGSTDSQGGGSGVTAAGSGTVTVSNGGHLQPYQILAFIIKAVP